MVFVERLEIKLIMCVVSSLTDGFQKGLGALMLQYREHFQLPSSAA